MIIAAESSLYHGLIVDRSEVLHRQVDERAPIDVLLARFKALIAKIEASQAQALSASATEESSR